MGSLTSWVSPGAGVCVCECLLEQVKKVLQGQAFPHATGTNLQSPGYFISY